MRFIIDQSMVGKMLIAVNTRGICAIMLGEDEKFLMHSLKTAFKDWHFVEDQTLCYISVALNDFTADSSKEFKIPLDIQGSPFQKAVWKKLCEIPRGSTLSYQDVAGMLGLPGAARAVGRACASNLLALIIPCHRVVSNCGALCGYRWGLNLKEKALEIEKHSTIIKSYKPSLVHKS